MLTALTWTHPVHGLVTELLCPTHEPPARQAFADLGIDYTERPVDQGRCHRCDGLRPWQGPQPPNGQAGQAPTSPDGGWMPGAPADAGWFHDGPRTAGGGLPAVRERGWRQRAYPSVASVTGGPIVAANCGGL